MGETVQQGVGHFDLQVEMFAWSGVVEKTLVLVRCVFVFCQQQSSAYYTTQLCPLYLQTVLQ